MNATAKCYRPGQILDGINFFVLNKGYNSGKPGYTPWVNSYVITCKSEEERNKLYYLCYALWITGCFRPLLTGSVIEFIRKHDFIHCVEKAECKTSSCTKQLTDCLDHLMSTDNKIARMHETIVTHQRIQYTTLRCLLA